MFNLFVKLYNMKCYYYENKCIYDYSNSINNWATKENEKGLSPNIPVNSNDPIGINIKRLEVRHY